MPHSPLFKTDADLQSRFLSSDLDEIARAASNSGSPGLLAIAGAPLKRRQEGLVEWRAKKVHEIIRDNPMWAFYFHQATAGAAKEKMFAGEVPLAAIDLQANALVLEYRRNQDLAQNDAREQIRETFRSAIADDPTANPAQAAVVVMFGNGEIKFYRHRAQGIDAARASEHGACFMVTQGGPPQYVLPPCCRHQDFPS